LESLRIDRPTPSTIRLAFHRPDKKNALDRALVRGFSEAMKAASADASIRVILLCGTGGAFCSGADLSSIEKPSAEDVEARIDEFHAMIWRIVDAPQPVVAVVDGPAVGFGADLALACDMRLFSDAGYLEEAFVKIGLMPDGGGTHFLPQFAGRRAFEMIALGQRLDAEACLELGIANRVVERAQLDTSALALAERLSASAPLALASIKKSLREAERGPLAQALSGEKRRQARLILSSDFQEGVSAFRQKRAPRFQGK
jgi:2-(1,2-epoxy-1,2-dihydrophenyl)acetyl-CoA isomerase